MIIGNGMTICKKYTRIFSQRLFVGLMTLFFSADLLAQQTIQPISDSVQPVNNGAAPTNVTGSTNFDLPARTMPEQALPPPVDTGPSSEDISQARNKAFDALTLTTLPMTGEQIRRLRGLFSQSQRAASAYPVAPPKAVISSQYVSLEPGATPPVIRLGQGFVSSVLFVDSTGAPWPIQSYDIGNPNAYNIQWDKVSNILMMQSITQFTMGNLAIQLKGLSTPIMITIVPGQPVVDYRLEMRVQGLGPNAKQGTVNEGLPDAANSSLMNLLDGVAPPKAKQLSIPNSNSQAWLIAKDKIYLRTRLTLLSPAWISKMTSADGMNAYEIPKTPSLLVSNQGQIYNLLIEGF
jgi:intracellular multiplication protein IcmK